MVWCSALSLSAACALSRLRRTALCTRTIRRIRSTRDANSRLRLCTTSPHHSTAQHSHSTAQHSTAQHSTAQHSTAQHSTAHQHKSAIEKRSIVDHTNTRFQLTDVCWSQHSTAQHSAADSSACGRPCSAGPCSAVRGRAVPHSQSHTLQRPVCAAQCHSADCRVLCSKPRDANKQRQSVQRQRQSVQRQRQRQAVRCAAAN